MRWVRALPRRRGLPGEGDYQSARNSSIGTRDAKQAARAAQLIKVHAKIQLSPEELVRVATWVDTNAQYYGTYWGRKNLNYKDLPDFRPVPTFEMARSMTQP